MHIRRLTPEDAPSVRAVRLEGLKNHPENFGADHDEEAARPIEWWRQRAMLTRDAATPRGLSCNCGDMADLVPGPTRFKTHAEINP